MADRTEPVQSDAKFPRERDLPERGKPTPKTSGAPERGKEPLVNPDADRNTEGPREAGATPRPTDKPITGR